MIKFGAGKSYFFVTIVGVASSPAARLEILDAVASFLQGEGEDIGHTHFEGEVVVGLEVYDAEPDEVEVLDEAVGGEQVFVHLVELDGQLPDAVQGTAAMENRKGCCYNEAKSIYVSGFSCNLS